MTEVRDEEFEPEGKGLCLPFTMPLRRRAASDNAAGEAAPMLISYTRALSKDFMELLVPSLPFLYRYLLSEDLTLHLELRLPTGVVLVDGTPTYDRPLDGDDAEICYMVTGDCEVESIPLQYFRHDRDGADMSRIIGVSIKHVGGPDSALYGEYLKTIMDEPILFLGEVIVLPDEHYMLDEQYMQHDQEVSPAI